MPPLGPELLSLHEVQLCLAQEQQLLEDLQWRGPLWTEGQPWSEEQQWLQQLQEEQAWVQVEGLQLALALEQLRNQGLEVLYAQGQVRPGGQGGGRVGRWGAGLARGTISPWGWLVSTTQPSLCAS